MANYADSIFKDPNSGELYSLVNGVARKFSDQQAALALAPNAQTKTFGQDTSGYNPGRQERFNVGNGVYEMITVGNGGGTTGGAWDVANFKNTFDSYAAQNAPQGATQQNISPYTNPNALSQPTGFSIASASGTPSNNPYASVANVGQFKSAFQTVNGRAPTDQEVTNFLQNRSTAPVPSSVITPNSLQKESNLSLPRANVDGLDQAGALVAGGKTALSQLISQLTPPKTEAEAKQQSLLDQMASLTGTLANKAADQLTQEQSAGLPQLRQQFADINGQILTKSAEYEALLKANEGKPITMNSIIGNERQILNSKAADIGLLTAKAQALQGQIGTAQETVNRSIDLKYSTIQNSLDIYRAQLAALEPTLNKEEKVRAAAQQQLLDEKKQALEDAKQAEKDQTNYVLNLAAKYPDAKIDISSDTPQQAQAKISNSRIYQDQVRGPVRSSGSSGGAIVNLNGQSLKLSNQQIDNISPVVNSFKTEPIVQNFNTIAEGYQFAKNLSNQTTNPADDQALVYALAKALDPGSVVREGEYATVQKYAQSWVKSFDKSVSQAVNGTGFLSETARENIKSTIASRFNASQQNYNNIYNETARRVELVGSLPKGTGTQFLNNYAGGYTVSQPTEKTTPAASSAATNYIDTLNLDATPKQSGGVLNSITSYLSSLFK